jgi:TonB-linked SusC/RagA family outer membrane protein
MKRQKLFVTSFLLCIFFVSYAKQASAQQKLKGYVLDETTLRPVEGANVKSSINNVVTDKFGKFLVAVGAADKSIEISYVGYTAQKVSFSNVQDSLLVYLKNTANTMDEIVVVGYGTARKSDITGAVTKITAKDFNQGANVSADQLIAGKVSGVQVIQNSGEPGGGISVNVRGMGSINAGNSPLYVIDGFPIDNGTTVSGTGANFTGMRTSRNPLNSINPNDIESIEILKDASATAIYGSRGANGVVLITTKAGKTGGLKVDYDVYFGVQNVMRDIDLLSAQEYQTVMNELIQAGAGTAAQTVGNFNGGTNWLENMYNRNASLQNHNVSLSGGDEVNKFYASLNYYDQNGILINSSNRRYTARLNLEHNKNNFRTGFNLTTSYVKDNYVANGMDLNERAGIIYAAIAYDPTLPIYTATGTYTLSPDMNIDNPLAIANGKTSISNLYRTLGTAFGELTFLKDFKARLNLGADISNQRRDTYVDRQTIEGRANGGIASILSGMDNSFLSEFTVSYNKQWNIHDLNAVAGVTAQQFGDRDQTSQGSGFSSDATKTDNLGLGDPTKFIATSGRQANSLLSYLGRVNYNLLNKYLLTASLRVDGSSRFGANNKYGVFPSFALGWKMEEEQFIKNLNVFNTLKLRASWGRTGNQEIGNYQSVSTLGAGWKAVIGDGQVSTTTPSRLANPDLKWETSEQLNLGLDYALLSNRISGSIDWFVKDTKDMLLSLPISRSTGFSTMMTNIGRVRNAGIELMVNTKNLTGKLAWETTFNFSYLTNEVLDLGGLNNIFSGSAGTSTNVSILRVGSPMYSFFGYQIDGIWQTGDDFTVTTDNVKPGDIRYRDVDGNRAVNAQDRVIIGNSFPKYNSSITNNLTYKGFNLNIFIDGVFGVSMLNNNMVDTYFPANLKRNRLAEPLLNRWTPSNPSNIYPSFINTATQGTKQVNTYTVEDASFVRLNTVRLGYSFKISNFNYIKGINVYVAGQNLAMITDYKGYDPSINPSGSGARIDWNAYPTARTFLLGLNLNL